MKTIMRFALRDEGTGRPDSLVLGKMLNQTNLLKSGVVYEMRDVLGEIMITPIGKASTAENPVSYWAGDVNSNVTSGDHLLTEEEFSSN